MQRKVALKPIIGLGPNNTTAYVNDIVEVTDDQLKSIGKDRLVEPTEADMVAWRNNPKRLRPSGADPRMGISDSRPGEPYMGRPGTTDPRIETPDMRTLGPAGTEHTIDPMGQPLEPRPANPVPPAKPVTPEPSKKDK